MAADRKIIECDENGKPIKFYSECKIMHNDKIACSYWGYVHLELKSKTIDLKNIIEAILDKNLSIDETAKDICNELNKHFSKYDTGVHLAGFEKNEPIIYHIFWLKRENRFVIENSKLEYYDVNGVYHKYEVCQKYFILFNGENQVAKIIEEIPEMIEKKKIDYKMVGFNDAKNIAKTIISITSDICKDVCGLGLDMLVISSKQIKEITDINGEEMSHVENINEIKELSERINEMLSKDNYPFTKGSGSDP